MSIRIVDMPDLGAVTDDSSVVGEHAGSGRFAMTAMRNYITTTGGGPFLPLVGGNLTGNLTTSATANIIAGSDVLITGAVHVGSHGDWEWSFSVDPATGSKIQNYRANWYDRWDSTSGERRWVGPAGDLMILNGAGDLRTEASVSTAYIHSSGNANVDGTLTAGAINAPGGTYTGTTVNVTGNISGHDVSAGGNITANGYVSGAAVYAGVLHAGGIGSDFMLQIDGGGNRTIYWSSTWALSWAVATGNLAYVRNDGVMMFNSIGYTGDFGITGNNAFKPGGGSWAAPSDSRIKTVTGDYTRGLAEIKALSPKRFIYRGNDTTEQPDAATAAPYKSSPHYLAATNNNEFAGLVAQDLEAVMPEMVTKQGGYIDGTAANDIMTVDRSSLDLALVNAIKELEARIAALEAVGMAAQRTAASD